MRKRVFVTGAGGFIGSHLTEVLATAGYLVRAIVLGLHLFLVGVLGGGVWLYERHGTKLE